MQKASIEKIITRYKIKDGSHSGKFIHAKTITDIKGKSKSKYKQLNQGLRGNFLSSCLAYSTSNAQEFQTFIIYNHFTSHMGARNSITRMIIFFYIIHVNVTHSAIKKSKSSLLYWFKKVWTSKFWSIVSVYYVEAKSV